MGDHKHKIVDRTFIPKYGTLSQVLLQLVVALRIHRHVQVRQGNVQGWLRESVVGGLNVTNDPKCNIVLSPCTYKWSQKIHFVSNFPTIQMILRKSIIVQKRAYLSNDIMENLVYEKPIQFSIH